MLQLWSSFICVKMLLWQAIRGIPVQDKPLPISNNQKRWNIGLEAINALITS